MKPIKKVGITIYVPAGDICEGSAFSCPMLMQFGNTPASFCVLIPDSFWWNWQRKTKHKECPSLYRKANELSEDDIRDHRLRIVQKAIKNHIFDNYLFDDGREEE